MVKSVTSNRAAFQLLKIKRKAEKRKPQTAATEFCFTEGLAEHLRETAFINDVHGFYTLLNPLNYSKSCCTTTSNRWKEQIQRKSIQSHIDHLIKNPLWWCGETELKKKTCLYLTNALIIYLIKSSTSQWLNKKVKTIHRSLWFLYNFINELPEDSVTDIRTTSKTFWMKL